MNNYEIQFLIKTLNKAIDDATEVVQQLARESIDVTDPRHKIRHKMMETVGTQNGNMMFVRDQLEQMITKKKTKKFWQFWK